MPLWLSLGLFALIAGLIVWLFIWRGRIDRGLEKFIRDSGFTRADAVPETAVEAFGRFTRAFRGRIVTRDRTVEFLWLDGSSTSTVGTDTTLHIYHGIVLSRDDANFRVEGRCREIMARKSPLRDFFVFNTDRPIAVERLPDHSLLIRWRGLDRADVYRKKLEFLSGVLS